MLEHLNAVNDVKVYSVFDREFESYGKLHTGFDLSELTEYMEIETKIPESGNIYVPSVEKMEKTAVCDEIEKSIYGEMPIQIGYCNGKNTTYNGFEYHKCSEVNIAVTDFMLVLGHIWQIENGRFYVGNEKVFFVPRGAVVEMYQTTLHLSPCAVSDHGFKDIVILLKGTNTPLEHCKNTVTDEDEMLLMKNKWVLAHKDREVLVKQGAHIGLIGENKKLKY